MDLQHNELIHIRDKCLYFRELFDSTLSFKNNLNPKLTFEKITFNLLVSTITTGCKLISAPLGLLADSKNL